MAVSEQAPSLDVEPEVKEKQKVVTNDDFEERLAQIRRYPAISQLVCKSFFDFDCNVEPL